MNFFLTHIFLMLDSPQNGKTMLMDNELHSLQPNDTPEEYA